MHVAGKKKVGRRIPQRGQQGKNGAAERLGSLSSCLLMIISTLSL